MSVSVSAPYSARLDQSAVCIFLFHGVIRRQRHAVRNYTTKHLELERFREILRDLKEKGNSVSISQILEATTMGRALPPYPFAITFDDGFANNGRIAAPVLEEFRISATFYVTTGFVGSSQVSWTDRIEAALEEATESRLDLPQIGLEGRFTTPASKRAAMEEIRRRVKSDPAIDPYVFAENVCRQLGIPELPDDPELDAKMTWEEAAALHAHPLFTVGGHSHTHRIMSFLNPAELENEVRASVELLRRHLPGPVVHYSYPEGLSHCYSNAVIERLKAHGIRSAVTAQDGVNPPGVDPFLLKRIWVF